MNIEKFNEEFKKFKKEASDYLTDNVLNCLCDQKIVNTATIDLSIILDRFLYKIGVNNYNNYFSIKCEFVPEYNSRPEYYSRYDCFGNEYKELTGKYTLRINFYYKDELIKTTNELYAYAFPIINTYDINIIDTSNISINCD